MTDYRELLRVLAANDVRVIIVGGAAATAHGSSRLTDDLDLVYQREPENVGRIIESLRPYDPYPRDAPAGLPFRWHEDTIRHGLNFTLTTALGAVDLLGEIALGGTYEQLLPYSIQLEIFGHKCFCLGLERLIEVKHAAGRPKDREAVAELQIILTERSR
jgi:predicted nucleotidyltransferase